MCRASLSNTDQSVYDCFERFYTPNSPTITIAQRSRTTAVGWDTANYVMGGTSTDTWVIREQGVHTGTGDGDAVNGNTVTCDIYVRAIAGSRVSGAAPVVVGQRYCYSLYYTSHRCDIRLYLALVDASDNVIAYAASAPFYETGGLANSLSAMHRASYFFTVPSGTARTRVFVRKYNTYSGQSDSYLWLAAPMLEAVNASATSPSPYVPGAPLNTSQISDTAGLGTTATWAGVSGAGKPINNAGQIVDAGNGTTLFGQRQRNDPPADYPVGLTLQFKSMASIGLTATGNGYCTLETNKGYGDNSGVYVVQYAYDNAGTAYKRWGTATGTSWGGAWTLDLDRNSYTGDLNATNGAPSGTNVGGVAATTVAGAATAYNGQVVGITLGGSQTTFYPVAIASSLIGGAAYYDVVVSRPNVHADSSWLGSYTCHIFARASAYGNAPGAIVEVDQITGAGTYTSGVSNVYLGAADQKIIVMMRGGMSHTISLSQPIGAYTVTPYMSGYTDGSIGTINPETTGTLLSFLNQAYCPNARIPTDSLYPGAATDVLKAVNASSVTVQYALGAYQWTDPLYYTTLCQINVGTVESGWTLGIFISGQIGGYSDPTKRDMVLWVRISVDGTEQAYPILQTMPAVLPASDPNFQSDNVRYSCTGSNVITIRLCAASTKKFASSYTANVIGAAINVEVIKK